MGQIYQQRAGGLFCVSPCVVVRGITEKQESPEDLEVCWKYVACGYGVEQPQHIREITQGNERLEGHRQDLKSHFDCWSGLNVVTYNGVLERGAICLGT